MSQLPVSFGNVDFQNNFGYFFDVNNINNINQPTVITQPIPPNMPIPIPEDMPIEVPVDMGMDIPQSSEICKSDIWKSYCLLGPNPYFLSVYRQTPNSSLIQPCKNLCLDQLICQ